MSHSLSHSQSQRQSPPSPLSSGSSPADPIHHEAAPTLYPSEPATTNSNMSPKRSADDQIPGPDSRPAKRSRPGVHTKLHYSRLFQQESHTILTGAPVVSSDVTDELGLISWTPEEKARFFELLSRNGRHAIDVIAKGLGSKSEPEVADYLRRLREAYVERHLSAERTGLLRFDEMPAAVEDGEELEAVLDGLADELSRADAERADREEAAEHGDLAVIDGDNVDELYGEDEDEDEAEIEASSNNHETDDATTSTNPLERERSGQDINLNTASLPAAAAVLDTPRLLELSQYVFMNSNDPAANYRTLHLPTPQAPSQVQRNRSTPISRPTSSQSHTHPGPESPFPALHSSTLLQLHTHLLTLTRRLTSTAHFLALSRIRTMDTHATRTPLREVREQDVLAALDILGLTHNAHDFWVRVPRKCGLNVFRGRAGARAVRLGYDEVEEVLAAGGRWPRASESAVGDGGDVEMAAGEAVERDGDVADDASVASDVSFESRAPTPGGVSDMESEGEDVYADSGPESDSSRDDAELSATDAEDVSADVFAETVDAQAAALDEAYVRAALQGKPSSKSKTQDGDDEDGNKAQAPPTPKRRPARRKTVEELKDWRDWMVYKAQWERYPRPVVHGERAVQSIEKPDHDASAVGSRAVRRASESPGMAQSMDVDRGQEGEMRRGRPKRSRSKGS